jgi:pimeloyl-ACP methyl ester carboxylesterase
VSGIREKIVVSTEEPSVTQFVLVPGAWLGGWAWDAVASRLREAGHEAHAVTLTGLGEREAEGGPETDLDTHANDVIGLIESQELRDVTLVAHSYAGLVAAVVADRIPERLARVVYLDTGPVPDGWSMLDWAGEEAAALEREVAAKGDGWRLPYPGVDRLGPPTAIAGLGEAERAILDEKAVAQPFGTYRQAVRTSRPFDGEYERIVVLAGGMGLPLAEFRTMIGPDGPFAVMTGPDWKAVQLATGHWPMLSDPEKLATLLDAIATGSAALEPLNPTEA